jgi:hypothetical protein
VPQTIPELCTYRLEFERFYSYEIMEGMVLGGKGRANLSK